jgi:hypothetical protein
VEDATGSAMVLAPIGARNASECCSTEVWPDEGGHASCPSRLETASQRQGGGLAAAPSGGFAATAARAVLVAKSA